MQQWCLVWTTITKKENETCCFFVAYNFYAHRMALFTQYPSVCVLTTVSKSHYVKHFEVWFALICEVLSYLGRMRLFKMLIKSVKIITNLICFHYTSWAETVVDVAPVACDCQVAYARNKAAVKRGIATTTFCLCLWSLKYLRGI